MNKRCYQFGHSEISVIFGNIIDSKAKVIVSSDDTDLSMGGGVSLQIRLKAGPSIRLDVPKLTPCDIGDVIVTTAGEMEQQYIFHCTTIDYHHNFQTFSSLVISQSDVVEYVIRRCVDKCFRLLNSLDIDSIAFPVLGSGVAGMPFVEVCEIMADAFANNLADTSKSLAVELYVYDVYNRFSEDDYISLFESFSAKASILNYIRSKEKRVLSDNEPKESPSEVKNSKDVPIVDEHEVFISYSRKDSAFADQVCEMLDANKITYWIDRTGTYCGISFEDMIAQAIDSSRAVIFLSSKNSNKSQYVKREISYAVSKDIPILPMMLDNTPLKGGLALDLSHVHRIDYSESSNWQRELLSGLSIALSRVIR